MTIRFSENGTYQIFGELIFDPPQYERKTLHHILNTNKSLLSKLGKGISLKPGEVKDLKRFPATTLICYLNGFEEAEELMLSSRKLLKEKDSETYRSLKEALRILRKVRYN